MFNPAELEKIATEYLASLDPYLALAGIREFGAVAWWAAVHKIQLAQLTLAGGQNVL